MEREAPKKVHGKERPLSELKMIDSGMGILLKEICKCWYTRGRQNLLITKKLYIFLPILAYGVISQVPSTKEK